jgi:hypothetical protein
MGNMQSIQKINFEDVQFVIKNYNSYIIINTLSENEQNCLIPFTTNILNEADLINNMIKSGNKEIKIIIYGKNCNDEKIYTKYNQLNSLGFYNLYLYTGGIFEWLLLQDIYGSEQFPSSSIELDILKFKPNKRLNINLIQY